MEISIIIPLLQSNVCEHGANYEIINFFFFVQMQKTIERVGRLKECVHENNTLSRLVIMF